MGIFSFFSKEKKETLDKGLSKTKENVFSKITRAIAGKSKVDDEVLDNLEEVLITSDVGVDTTLKIISRIEDRVARDKYVTTSELTAILREEIASLLTENHTEDLESFTVPEDKKPYVIMVVGVNGVGKTTTIGKLAYQFKKAGKNVYLGAADTFRAAAVEQLVIWSVSPFWLTIDMNDTPAPYCSAMPSIAPAISCSTTPGRHICITCRCILVPIVQARSISAISSASLISRSATTVLASGTETYCANASGRMPSRSLNISVVSPR